ncbi:unnamed protein product [Didymodactylos carnosus]|uniref:Uncharacterized protein n=1 Tax=Didymodactylos carnosus TaxID=1234261 RepID=A0A815DMH2_9BILA|nr:unnamed protein product [Didymodactylos carnosus]CAF1571013.1 unnamed protein product [Didymodactylos carnosus]CAF4122770.1 unnamed protein product [Didymodactylos carnosus]CAF4365654.1 unnamed protein product [Didymodactylos carnosus]
MVFDCSRGYERQFNMTPTSKELIVIYKCNTINDCAMEYIQQYYSEFVTDRPSLDELKPLLFDTSNTTVREALKCSGKSDISTTCRSDEVCRSVTRNYPQFSITRDCIKQINEVYWFYSTDETSNPDDYTYIRKIECNKDNCNSDATVEKAVRYMFTLYHQLQTTRRPLTTTWSPNVGSCLIKLDACFSYFIIFMVRLFNKQIIS